MIDLERNDLIEKLNTDMEALVIYLQSINLEHEETEDINSILELINDVALNHTFAVNVSDETQNKLFDFHSRCFDELIRRKKVTLGMIK